MTSKHETQILVYAPNVEGFKALSFGIEGKPESLCILSQRLSFKDFAGTHWFYPKSKTFSLIIESAQCRVTPEVYFQSMKSMY